MNCEDMVKIPELENVLLLRAGAGGMKKYCPVDLFCRLPTVCAE